MPPMNPSSVRSPRWRAIWLMLLPLLVASACQLGGAGAPTATLAPGAATLTPAAAVGPTPTAAAVDPGPVEIVIGSGPFALPDASVGLDTLPSYNATLLITFDGQRAGQPLHWTQTYVLNVTPNAARQITVDRSGDPAAALFLAEVAGVAYERRGQQACTAIPLEAGASDLDRFLPAALLTPVIGADEAGRETVNGLAALHYTFDERALGQSGLTTSTGAVWVAADGGHVVKYTTSNTGEADFFGADLAGTLAFDYQLTTPADPSAAAVPADCPPGFVPAQPLPDATNLVNLPGLLSFDTATSLAEAGAYYQAQLTAAGWAPLNDPVVTPTTQLLDFAQGDLQLTVLLTATPTGATVTLIMVHPSPPPPP